MYYTEPFALSYMINTKFIKTKQAPYHPVTTSKCCLGKEGRKHIPVSALTNIMFINVINSVSAAYVDMNVSLTAWTTSASSKQSAHSSDDAGVTF